MTTSPFTTPVSSRFLRPLLAGCAVFALLAAPVRAAEPEAPAAEDPQNAAQSQPVSSGPIEEIMVTAQKRAQRLQDVGVSVTAFTESMLERIGFKDSTQIVQQVPNFNYGTPVGQGNNPAFAMRAVGLVNPFEDNQEGKVAIYRDGVYQGTLAGQTLQMFDLERVEVLRGPQGTLYGRNSTGGLVNFIPRKPGDELGGFVEGVGGEFSQVRLTAGVDLPVSDRVRTRFAIDFNRDDGYVRNRFRAENFNTAGVRGNDTNTFAGRGLIAIDLDDDTDLLFNVHGSRVDQLAPYYQHQGVLREDRSFCSAEEMQQINGCFDFFDYADQDNHDAFAGSYDRRGVLQIKNVGGYMTLTRRFANGMELVSQTAVEHFSKLHQEDTDMSPVALIEPDFGVNATQFSQELRLVSSTPGPFQWFLGASVYKEEIDASFAQQADEELMCEAFLEMSCSEYLEGDFTPNPLGLFETNDARGRYKGFALYADATYEVLPRLELNAGIRYTYDRKNFGLRINPVDSDLGPFFVFGYITDPAVNNGFITETRHWDQVTPRFTARWHVSDETTVWASVTKGYKSGGFGTFSLTLPTPEELGFTPEEIQACEDEELGVFCVVNDDGTVPEGTRLSAFDPEKVWSYEAGIKGSLLGRVLQYDLNVYYYDYKDLQITFFDEVLLNTLVANVGQVDGLGFEGTIRARPGERWNLLLSVAYSHTDIAKVPASICEDCDGNRLTQNPKWTFGGLLQYAHPLPRGRLLFSTELHAQTDFFGGLDNLQLTKIQGYADVGLRLAYEADAGWEVAVYVDNVTNDLYYDGSIDAEFPIPSTFFGPSRPRTFGIDFYWRFGGG